MISCFQLQDRVTSSFCDVLSFHHVTRMNGRLFPRKFCMASLRRTGGHSRPNMRYKNMTCKSSIPDLFYQPHGVGRACKRLESHRTALHKGTASFTDETRTKVRRCRCKESGPCNTNIAFSGTYYVYLTLVQPAKRDAVRQDLLASEPYLYTKSIKCQKQFQKSTSNANTFLEKHDDPVSMF